MTYTSNTHIQYLRICLLSVLLIGLSQNTCLSQKTPIRAGKRTVTSKTFGPNEYGSHDGKNWSFLISDKGIPILLNDIGILALREKHWDHYISGPQLGGIRFLNELKPNHFHFATSTEFGSITIGRNIHLGGIHSNESRVNIASEKFTIKEIKGSFHLKKASYFNSENALYFYRDDSVKHWKFDSTIRLIQMNRDTGFAVAPNNGIYLLTDNGSKKLPNTSELANKSIIHGYSQGAVISFTDRQGLVYSYSGRRWRVNQKLLISTNTALTCGYKSNTYKVIVYGSKNYGLIITDYNGKIVSHLSETDGIDQYNIQQIAEDIDNGFWFLSSQGITYVNYPSLYTIIGRPEGLFGKSWAINVWQNRLWIGTSEGLFYLSVEDAGSYNGVVHQVPTVVGDVHQLLLRKDKLLIATDSGLYQIEKDFTTQRLTHVNTHSIAGVHNQLNTFYVGTDQGVDRVSLSSNPNELLLHHIDGINCRSRTLTTDSQNNLYVGTFDQGAFVFTLDPEQTHVIQMYNLEYGDKIPVNAGKVNVLNLDEDAFVETSDIYAYDLEQDSFSLAYDHAKHTWQRDWCNTIYVMTKDPDNNYLILRNGTDTLHLQDGSFIWPEWLFEQNAYSYNSICYDTRDSSLWLTTNDGILNFDGAHSRVSKKEDTTYLQSLKVMFSNNQNIPTEQSITYVINSNQSDEIEIPQNHYFLRVDYFTPTQDIDRPISYNYTIDDIPTGSTEEQHILLGNLSRGRHEIKIFREYRHNLNKSISATVKLKIIPSWYQTRLAYLLYIISPVLLMYLSARLYNRRLRRQRVRLRYRNHVASREIRVLAHDLKIKNQELKKKNEKINALLYDTIHRTKGQMQLTKNLLQMQGHILKDSKALDALLDTQNRINLLEKVQNALLRINLETQQIDLRPLIINSVKDITEAYGYDKTVNIKFDIDNIQISAEQAAMLGLIITELIINALKHAFPTIYLPEIKIRINETSSHINVLVQDNGTGYIPKASSGFGTKLIDIFIQQLGATYEFETKNGVTFSMTIPIETETL